MDFKSCNVTLRHADIIWYTTGNSNPDLMGFEAIDSASWSSRAQMVAVAGFEPASQGT